uniref:Uncharacterized protein n=1 Tax=Arundo donax TaxID=35708 RepID=A0A0A8YBL8_ARUDO
MEAPPGVDVERSPPCQALSICGRQR